MIHRARSGRGDRQYLHHSGESAPGYLPERWTRISAHTANLPVAPSKKSSSGPLGDAARLVSMQT